MPQNNDEQWAGDGPNPAGGGKFMGVSTVAHSKYCFYRLYLMLTLMLPLVVEISRLSKMPSILRKKRGEGTAR